MSFELLALGRGLQERSDPRFVVSAAALPYLATGIIRSDKGSGEEDAAEIKVLNSFNYSTACLSQVSKTTSCMCTFLSKWLSLIQMRHLRGL